MLSTSSSKTPAHLSPRPLTPAHSQRSKVGHWYLQSVFSYTYRACVTLDGGPEELGHGDEDAAGDQDGGGRLVEELEAPVVDADLVDLEEAAGGLRHRPDQVRHLDSLTSLAPLLHISSHLRE